MQEAKDFGLRYHKNPSSSEVNTIAKIYLKKIISNLVPKDPCLWDQIIWILNNTSALLFREQDWPAYLMSCMPCSLNLIGEIGQNSQDLKTLKSFMVALAGLAQLVGRPPRNQRS